MFFTSTQTECCPDWVIECQNFACGDALHDAVYRSIFTERADPICNRDGWWGDPSFGSDLSRLSRRSSINATLAELEDTVSQALAWMVSSGVIKDLSVTAEFTGTRSANIRIQFDQPTSCELIIPAEIGQFGWVWNNGNS